MTPLLGGGGAGGDGNGVDCDAGGADDDDCVDVAAIINELLLSRRASCTRCGA